MTQPLHYWIGNTQYCQQIPDAEAEVISGVQWGEPWQLFTPAYWLSQFPYGWLGTTFTIALSSPRISGVKS